MADPVILSTGPVNPNAILYGVNASITDGDTFVDLSAESPTLTNVPVDGSAIISVNTSTGIQTYVIIAASNVTKKVSINGTFHLTETGRSWAIYLLNQSQCLLMFKP